MIMSSRKLKILLIITLLFIPTIVFAESYSLAEPIPLSFAFVLELFVSIHMCIFVFQPLSNMLSKEGNEKKNFWKIFAIRAAILLFFDFFITTSIAYVDFVLIFLGAFIIVPLCGVITKKNPYMKKTSNYVRQSPVSATNLGLKCTKCNQPIKSTDQYCTNCGALIAEKDKQQISNKIVVVPSNFDPMYSLSEDKMLEKFINRNLKIVGLDINTTLLPQEISKKRLVLNSIFSFLIFIYISLIFFHFPIYTYILGFIILIILYFLTRKYDLMSYLKKQLKARPQEKVSNIIMSVKQSLVIDNSKRIFIVTLVIATIMPLIIFMNPRIMYEKMDDGYGVRFYTFGLTNFTTATIPEIYNGEKVVSLRGNTFSNMPFLREVNLPNSILEIRGQAFKNDRSLTTITLPNQLKYLGGGSFYNCSSLKSIEIPDTVTFIGGESFYNATSLEYINLPKNITEIRGNTFENCKSLQGISIPDNVTRIGGHAFFGCSSLSEVTLTENSRLTEIGSSAFRQCYSLYEVFLPKYVSINERAFKESPTRIRYFDELYDDSYYSY